MEMSQKAEYSLYHWIDRCRKEHKLRYHNFQEMYDDAQGFKRKPVDSERVK